MYLSSLKNVAHVIPSFAHCSLRPCSKKKKKAEMKLRYVVSVVYSNSYVNILELVPVSLMTGEFLALLDLPFRVIH